jgi:hypothetical protein
MTTTSAIPYNGYASTPAQLPSADNAYGSKVQVYHASFVMAAQASGDTIKLMKLPKGCVPLFGVINTDATMGATATVAIGIAGTTGKYRAAAIKTTTVPEVFMVSTANHSAGVCTPLASEEEILLTIAAAALPGAGNVTVDIYVASL